MRPDLNVTNARVAKPGGVNRAIKRAGLKKDTRSVLLDILSLSGSEGSNPSPRILKKRKNEQETRA